jgi:hypothetical protein
MLKRIVTYFLGPWGMNVLRFYIANSVWINAVIISYMLILTIAYVNYRGIKMQIMDKLQAEINLQSRRKKFSVSMNSLDIKKPLLPLISGKLSFFPRRYSIRNIEDMLNADVEVRKLREGIRIELS